MTALCFQDSQGVRESFYRYLFMGLKIIDFPEREFMLSKTETHHLQELGLTFSISS